MRLDKSMLRKLALRTISYFTDELRMSNINDKFTIENVNKIDYNDLSTFISLSRDMAGTVSMSVSKELAKQMVSHFVYGNITQEEIDELAAENISETLNITLGNILKDIEIVQNGGNVEISSPYIMHNKVSISKKKDGKMYLCRLKYDNEDIILSYLI